MVIYNGNVDPYHPKTSRYECPSCGARLDSGGTCDQCGGDHLQNIAVARE